MSSFFYSRVFFNANECFIVYICSKLRDTRRRCTQWCRSSTQRRLGTSPTPQWRYEKVQDAMRKYTIRGSASDDRATATTCDATHNNTTTPTWHVTEEVHDDADRWRGMSLRKCTTYKWLGRERCRRWRRLGTAMVCFDFITCLTTNYLIFFVFRFLPPWQGNGNDGWRDSQQHDDSDANVARHWGSARRRRSTWHVTEEV
jgi:hypothetical protein